MIRILLLDDHAVVRTGYRRLLDAEGGFEVVAEAGTADAAYACVQAGGIDVAVVDLSLGRASGIEAIRRMVTRAPQLKVLVLSMHDNTGFVTQAMRAGALGYLTKNSEPEEVFHAIREVAAGHRVMCSDVAQRLANTVIDGEDPLTRLTPREFEVLRMAAHGDSAADIAGRMHLSSKTILNHLWAIRQKLEVDNDFKLVRLAAQHGLVEFDA